jgi:chromosomal replication initiation ATPase DnaA
MNQIALPLDWPAAEERESFIVGISNEAAVRRIEAFGTWQVATMILSGPRKSGRSLFGRIFAQRAGAVLIDDAETRDETMIFHAWNDAQARRQPLLLVSDAAPPTWKVRLPDLRSRLAATPVVSFGDPDEGLIADLIAHLLERRGIMVTPELITYLNPRVERSHHAVINLVDRLDAASLSRHRPITVPLAREVLAVDGRGAVA